MDHGGVTPPLELDALVAEVRRRTGLDDFGSDWFIEPLTVLLDSIRREARLSDAGRVLQAENILNLLTNRLRTVEAVKRHPEILDEQVTVAATIVALHRTGSTLTHRMLSSAPQFTALRWWEAQYPCAFPGEARGEPVERRRLAQLKLEAWLQAMPELMSIHPMSLDEPDEETTILEQCFVGLSPESFLRVPSYAAWSETFDPTPAYDDLRTALKYLQWQDPGRRGRAWILKTPSHLPSPEVLARAFPETLIVMTHRDPLKTTPSFCSMSCTLQKMQSDAVDPVELGAHWSKRIAGLISRLLEARGRIGEHRFFDVRYEDLVAAPFAAAERIFAHMDRRMRPQDEAAIRAWLAANGRDNRPSHRYSLEQFGLSPEQVAADFRAYRERFILP